MLNHQFGSYYVSSGAIGAMGPVYMFIAGGLASVILGGIYAYANVYIPFIYINALFVLLYGLFIGGAVSYAGEIGKVRNETILMIFGFIAGVLAEYAAWVFWIYAYTSQKVFLLNPSEILEGMEYIAKKGAWNLHGYTPKGVMLYIFWICEAISVISCSTVIAYMSLKNYPFCENCNEWIKTSHTTIPLQHIKDIEILRGQLEHGNFQQLLEIKPANPTDTNFITLKLMHCPTCLHNDFLTIVSTIVTENAEKEKNTSETNIIENLIISAETYRLIKEKFPAPSPEEKIVGKP